MPWWFAIICTKTGYTQEKCQTSWYQFAYVCFGLSICVELKFANLYITFQIHISREYNFENSNKRQSFLIHLLKAFKIKFAPLEAALVKHLATSSNMI